MIEINKIAFIFICVFALVGAVAIIGASIKMICEDNKATKIKPRVFEKVKTYGVGIDARKLFNYEDICKGTLTELCKKCDELAKKHNCFAVMPKGNDAIYLFLVENSQIAYYNEVKQLTKAKLLKEPIMAEKEVK